MEILLKKTCEIGGQQAKPKALHKGAQRDRPLIAFWPFIAFSISTQSNLVFEYSFTFDFLASATCCLARLTGDYAAAGGQSAGGNLYQPVRRMWRLWE